MWTYFRDFISVLFIISVTSVLINGHNWLEEMYKMNDIKDFYALVYMGMFKLSTEQWNSIV